MTNAAFLLADQLEQWAVPRGQTPQQVRGFDNAQDLRAWRLHARVADYVTTLDQILAGMKANGESIEMFEPSLHSWYAAVNWLPTPWNSKTNDVRPACPEHEIRLLRALGALLEAGDQLVLTEDERRSLIDVLEEAEALLAGDSSGLPKDVRRYLWSLIVRAKNLVTAFDAFGPEAVRQTALELGGALHAQGERAEKNGDPATGSRWKSLATNLMVGFFGGAGGSTAHQVGEAAAKQLGGGG